MVVLLIIFFNFVKMFEKFFKDLLVALGGNYLEDFTEEDIQVDNWNGLVVKESCVVKTTAL